jgi:DNA polymerase-3 subunit gamma/tau
MTNDYQVLYRKFRPRKFSDIVGQDSIVTILKNQIKQNHIAHAYLFSGSRGTGKTSTAKVFARAINCESPVDGEPCGVCNFCVQFVDNNLTDIIEIDGASNRGIDEIRDLKEKINLMSVLGRYKVYIIDEVHMLTTEAFNALLKTLEEPPSHVVFIFATTELNKIPATILSRCPRRDFGRVSLSHIVSKLQEGADELNVTISPSSLQLIAQNCDGSLRDGWGILEKAISMSEDQVVTSKHVKDALGIADFSVIEEIATSVVNGSVSGAIDALDKAINNGIECSNIFNQLVDYFRALLIYITSENPERILKTSESELASLSRNRANVTPTKLIVYIKELSQAKSESKSFSDPRYCMECCLVAIADKDYISDSVSVKARLDRLERLFEGLRMSKGPTVQMNEPAEPTLPKASTPVQAPKASPKPIQDLASVTEAVIYASKFIKNKDRDIILSSIFEQLVVDAFDGTTAKVYPTKDAVNLMDIFEQKQGRQKLEKLLCERLERNVKVVILDAKTGEADPIDSETLLTQATELFNLTELGDEDLFI